ncbi:MAG: TetR/AcrR family transcriptional regulator [Chlorobi bacterium]|nr:TetR/AcrR family transcriptional regulator [Chlorobiota bacterium]
MDHDEQRRIPRRERERMMRRQDILQAARAVFARKGFGAAKLEDVAERAEFGKGTLYNYFTNKEALFHSVLDDAFQQIVRIADESFRAGGSFNQQIERFVRGQLEYFFRNPESLYLMMRESHHLQERNPLMQLMPQLLTILSEAVAAEQKRGKVIEFAKPMELAAILVSLLLGQFNSRVYSRICGHSAVNPTTDQLDLNALFDTLFTKDVDAEIEAASKLILTIYFRGINTQ